MDDLLSEKEQLDQMRSWWSEYGAYVIGGIVLGAGLLFGWNYYQNAAEQARLNASAAYERLVADVVDGDLEGAEGTAAEIAADFGDTTYAAQAGLAMARLYMDKNRDQDAADALLAIVDGNADEPVTHVARLRLARIYLYQEKAQEVVDLLADQESEAFAAAYGELRGDAFTALGRIAEAQDEYQKVMLNPLSRDTVDQQLVQWKSLDLPEVVVAVEVEETASDVEPAGDDALEESEPVVAEESE